MPAGAAAPVGRSAFKKQTFAIDQAERMCSKMSGDPLRRASSRGVEAEKGVHSRERSTDLRGRYYRLHNPRACPAKTGVWATDIIYIPMARGFLYLVVGKGKLVTERKKS
jgi:hypothetical protein